MPIPTFSRAVRVAAGLTMLGAAAAPSTGVAAAGGCGGATPIARMSDARVRRATECELNAQRRAAGLPPLHAVRSLTLVAQLHTGAMVARHALAHGNVGRRLRAYTAGHASMVGENIGTLGSSRSTVSQMVAAWMASPPHRANILQARFRDVGVGVVRRSTSGGQGATLTTNFGWRG